MQLKEHRKEEIADSELSENVREEDLSEKRLTRIYAVELTFERVNFSRSVIDSCYFRNCRFLECDFTGTHVSNCNFRGAQFEGCKFIYSEWEKTYLEDRFIDACLPSEENLARDLVRSLRVNYAQIGNYEAVNRAASIEVKLAGEHLYKSAFSRQSYYRKKYKGTERLKQALSFLKWKFLDLLWGNGESLIKVLVSATVLILLATFYIARVPSVTVASAFSTVMTHIWGIESAQSISAPLAILLVAGRLLFFGLFMAILVKRLSRR